jgi:hypothetical protein
MGVKNERRVDRAECDERAEWPSVDCLGFVDRRDSVEGVEGVSSGDSVDSVAKEMTPEEEQGMM